MDTWSGAIIYEWIEVRLPLPERWSLRLTHRRIQEQNDYGLVSYGPPAGDGATGVNVVDGFTRAGTPTPVNPDFDNLKRQWATLAPSGVSAAAYSPSLSPPACPRSTAGLWNIDGDVPLPTVGQEFDASGSGPSSQALATGTSATAGSVTQQTGSSVSDASPSASETRSSSASMGKRDMAEANPFRLLIQMTIGLAAMAVVAGLM